MAGHIPLLDSKTFENWIKLGIGVHYTRAGIEDTVIDDVKQLQQEILKEVYTQKGVRRGTICSECFTANVVPCYTGNFCNKSRHSPCTIHSLPGKGYRACPNKICDTFVKKICSSHHYSKPSWKNTNAERWCTDAVELAKCFMPRDGYDNVTTFQEVDFNGLVNVVINNKRLQSKFTDDLSNEDSIACKARNVGKTFRHSPNLAVKDEDLNTYIDILVDFLSDTTSQRTKTKDAIEMLKKLKTKKLNESSRTVVHVLQHFLEEKKQETSEAADRQKHDVSVTPELMSFLREVLVSAENVRQITSDNLNKIIQTKESVIKAIQDVGKKEKQAIIKVGRNLKRKATQHEKAFSKRMQMTFKEEKEKAIEDIRSTALTSGMRRESGKRLSESKDYPKLTQDLRSDLIELYRKQHINLPVSPMREENEVPLLEFYVKPSLKCKEFERRPYMKADDERTTTITSYNDIFFKEAKECKDIYLASPAGTGKTSFLKRMTLAWCYSHRPEEKEKFYFYEAEVTTMKEFNYLFFLSLRETSRSECHVDKMIEDQVISQLSSSYCYSADLIQEVLHIEKCLILIDGLDEWSHPIKACHSPDSVVPHRKERKNCTILTTTRPWKLEAVIESKQFIDQHIEMSGLEETSTTALIDNALHHLNARYHDNKSSNEFDGLMRQNRVHKLKSTPLLLLQMLCLWFAKGRLGNSRCEIYSNMLEFLFSHAMKRRSHSRTRSKTHGKAKKKHSSPENPPELPRFFSNCKLCHEHRDLLLALGHLAFDGLFGLFPESSLLFSQSVVEKHIDKDMLQLCKEIGILSQNNAYRKLIHTESNFSFIHKTYQEFLAAFYISLKCSQDVLKQMFLFCSTTENILQVSNVFVFVSGMHQETWNQLSEIVAQIVAKDEGTAWFRRNIGTIFIRSRVRMRRLHTMMMNCVQESYDNGFDTISALAQDIFINRKCKLDWLTEKSVIDKNMKNIRSLDIEANGLQNQLHRLMHSLDVQSLTGLEKIFVWESLPTHDIAAAIQSSCRSLVCLELWHLTLTDVSLSAMQGIEQLEALSILSVTMCHEQIQVLMDFLKETKHLRQLSLNEIKCLDDGQTCSGYILNLLENKKLEMCLLDKLHATEIKIDSQHLIMCVVDWMHVEGAVESLLNDLEHAPKLERLECDGIEKPRDLDKLVQVLPSLRALKYVKLRNIKLDNRHFELNNCDSLECIYMWSVVIKTQTLGQLLNKIKSLQRSVTVMLEGCRTVPEKGYWGIKQSVEKSSDFEIIRDTRVSNKYREFYFKTKG